MKKHEISYHEYDNSITFHFEFCNHLKTSNRSFSSHSNDSLQKTKKKLFFSKEKLIDQSEDDIQDIENKELLIFFKKINSKTILKRSTSNQVVKSVMRTLNESSKKLNERRRINEF
jgi:hypothetical protein